MDRSKAVGILVVSVTIISSVVFYHASFPSKQVPKQRGVSWVAGRRPVSEEDFKPLVDNHVDWIVQTPFGWQRNFNSPSLALVTDDGVMWGERDVGLETTTRLAKRLGIKTLLKPHIWLRSRSDGKWRGEIEMDTEADWQSWFESYRTFILHYARFAEKNGIEALCIGMELRTSTVTRELDWRDIIKEVRKVYSGQLTYGANWYLEFKEIQFWDELDFIGVQAYFPLADTTNPDLEELKAGWVPHRDSLEAISKKFNKPIVFTEIGYRSNVDGAVRPWEWPQRPIGTASEEDLQTQANCYEAFFQTFWQEDWCGGAYFWKWFPTSRRSGSGQTLRNFTPQNKPAEQVMARWYGKRAD